MTAMTQRREFLKQPLSPSPGPREPDHELDKGVTLVSHHVTLRHTAPLGQILLAFRRT